MNYNDLKEYKTSFTYPPHHLPPPFWIIFSKGFQFQGRRSSRLESFLVTTLSSTSAEYCMWDWWLTLLRNTPQMVPTRARWVKLDFWCGTVCFSGGLLFGVRPFGMGVRRNCIGHNHRHIHLLSCSAPFNGFDTIELFLFLISLFLQIIIILKT